MIRGSGDNIHQQLYWDGFFCANGYNLELVHDNSLPNDLLSEAEIEILEAVDREYKTKTYQDMLLRSKGFKDSGIQVKVDNRCRGKWLFPTAIPFLPYTLT